MSALQHKVVPLLDLIRSTDAVIGFRVKYRSRIGGILAVRVLPQLDVAQRSLDKVIQLLLLNSIHFILPTILAILGYIQGTQVGHIGFLLLQCVAVQFSRLDLGHGIFHLSMLDAGGQQLGVLTQAARELLLLRIELLNGILLVLPE